MEKIGTKTEYRLYTLGMDCYNKRTSYHITRLARKGNYESAGTIPGNIKTEA